MNRFRAARPFLRRAFVAGLLSLHLVIAPDVAFGPRAARADEAAAQEHFKIATTAYEQGDFAAAASAFEDAYRAAPHGSPMYNAAVAWEAAKDPARAADAYQLALDTPGLTPRQVADAKARLTVLERTLGRLEVNGPPGTTVTVAHVTGRPVPVKVHTAPGQQDIVVRFPDGQQSRQQLGVPAGVVVPVTVIPPVATPTPAAEQPPALPNPREPPEVEHTGSTQRTVGWVTIGGGVVLAGIGTYLGVSALDARDQFNATGHNSRDAHDRADSLRTWTNVVLVSAFAVTVAGVVLVLTAAKSAPVATTTARGASKAMGRPLVLTPGIGNLSLTF